MKTRIWRCGAGVILTLVVGTLYLLSTPALSQSGATTVSLEDAMAGRVEGLTVTVRGNGGYSGPSIRVDATNQSNRNYEVEVTPGTLLTPASQNVQEMVIAGPADDTRDVGSFVGSSTTLPAMLVGKGTSTHVLNAYCAQANDGSPGQATIFTYGGLAEEPLPRLMFNIHVADEGQVGWAQDAVWFLTDNANIDWLADPAKELLDGIDFETFASEPIRVVDDRNYVPELASRLVDRDGLSYVDESFVDNGSSSSGLQIAAQAAVALALVVGVGMLLARRKPSASP